MQQSVNGVVGVRSPVTVLFAAQTGGVGAPAKRYENSWAQSANPSGTGEPSVSQVTLR